MKYVGTVDLRVVIMRVETKIPIKYFWNQNLMVFVHVSFTGNNHMCRSTIIMWAMYTSLIKIKKKKFHKTCYRIKNINIRNCIVYLHVIYKYYT